MVTLVNLDQLDFKDLPVPVDSQETKDNVVYMDQKDFQVHKVSVDFQENQVLAETQVFKAQQAQSVRLVIWVNLVTPVYQEKMELKDQLLTSKDQQDQLETVVSAVNVVNPVTQEKLDHQELKESMDVQEWTEG